MKHPDNPKTRAHLHSWLVVGYALFIIYASLSPFSGWRNQGIYFAEVLQAPLPPGYVSFDAIVNLLSYLPFGLMLVMALRSRYSAITSMAIGLSLGLLLSASMEYMQMYLPKRTSSNMDVICNGVGTLVGAVLATSVASWTSLIKYMLRWRSSTFNDGKEMDFGLAMGLLWMFGQVNPSLPMLGNVFISEVARSPFAALPPEQFNWWESCAVTLNLLMLGTLLHTILRVPRQAIIALPVILCVVALAKFVAAALLLKSWALLLWINSEAIVGILVGMALLMAISSLPRNVATILGASVALAYFSVVNLLFGDNTPSSAMSVYRWNYGHLLNYNGLSQTIYLIFPLLLMLHLWRIRRW